MADCELLADCNFFNGKLVHLPATIEMMKTSYCHGDSSQCARFMIYQKLGRSEVPKDLSPSDVEKVKKILSSK